MQTPDGNSAGARSALMAMAADLKLHPVILARALEYVLHNISTIPNAEQAVCFVIVRQGLYVDMQLLDVALQRLRRDFGGVYAPR